MLTVYLHRNIRFYVAFTEFMSSQWQELNQMTRKQTKKQTSRKENYLSRQLMIRLQLKQREQVMQRISKGVCKNMFSCFHVFKLERT